MPDGYYMQLGNITCSNGGHLINYFGDGFLTVFLDSVSAQVLRFNRLTFYNKVSTFDALIAVAGGGYIGPFPRPPRNISSEASEAR